MPRRPDRPRDTSKYLPRFLLTALSLGGMTLFIVLVILPRKYLLSQGLRESGISFPAQPTTFSPPEEFHQPAARLPRAPPETPRGPGEIFWSEVLPLLRGERFAQALPLFERYLRMYPDDRGVRREYAITLSRAGRAGEAVWVLQELLAEEDDREIRLFLARSLRDLGRFDEASAEYARLLDEDPDNLFLALEWGRALSWAARYHEAAEVLEAALALDPAFLDVRIELARIYYWSGRLQDADRLLANVDPRTLETRGAYSLWQEVIAALEPPEPREGAPAYPPLTALRRAARATEAGDYLGAAAILQGALRSYPDDIGLWRAYADLLQYHLQDLDGARVALLRVEALGGATDVATRFRLAQLELWTGKNDQARKRLEGLLAYLESDPLLPVREGSPRPGPADKAEIAALLGDLYRWSGDRVRSGQRYRAALDHDAANARAEAGLEALREDADRDIGEAERPRFGGNAFSLSDSDAFSRLDLGAEGVGIEGDWVWGIRTGTRWARGRLPGAGVGTEQGLFMELEGARWWAWGTIRSGVHLGVDQLRPEHTDLTFGASLRLADLGGFRTDLRYDHGPAHPLTYTLQSVLAGVTQDRLTANLVRPVTPRLSLSLAGDGAWLSSPSGDGAGGEGSLRVEGGASLGRSVTDDLVMGLSARALTYTSAAPVVEGTRLFWDPRGLVSGGLYAQWEREAWEDWRFGARLSPSLAFIDERERPGWELVPHLAAEVGVSFEGRELVTDVGAFYYQGRLDGYRAYGLRLSFSAKDWFSKRGPS